MPPAAPSTVTRHYACPNCPMRISVEGPEDPTAHEHPVHRCVEGPTWPGTHGVPVNYAEVGSPDEESQAEHVVTMATGSPARIASIVTKYPSGRQDVLVYGDVPKTAQKEN